MELNLQPTSALDQADIKNKADIQLLRYRGETRQWGLTEYINAHKKHHQTQTELHDDHGFPAFTTREKVLFLKRGIKTSVSDLPLLQIDGDTAGACVNFELAQLKLLDFKSILNNCSNHNVAATQSQGQGGGGLLLV